MWLLHGQGNYNEEDLIDGLPSIRTKQLKVVSPLLIPVKNIIINVSRFEYGCEMKEILLPNGDFFFPLMQKQTLRDNACRESSG